MIQKLIKFNTFKKYCNREYDGECMDVEPEPKCCAKNCRLWAKLPLAVAQWEDSPILEQLNEIVGKTTSPKNKKRKL
jgi:hypothetical protein